MVSTQHHCAACGSEHIYRNGTRNGHARYRCKACGHQARFVPAAAAKALRYAQVEALLGERNSQRSIERATGVSRVTVAKLAKKSAAPVATAPPPAEKGATQTLGGAGTGRNVDVCGPQGAQGVAVAGG